LKLKSFFIAMFIAVVSVPIFAENNSADDATSSARSSVTPSSASSDYITDNKPCRWYQLRHCHPAVEGLPVGAPKEGVVITVDATHNIAYLFKDGALVAQGPASTGTDKQLRRGLKQWLFRTPRGRHKVLRKIVDPVWTKPDWAFVEEGKPVPPPNSPIRKVKGHMGKYALDLGDGILIHGTQETRKLGTKASHGCIRLGPEMLELVYQNAAVGTEVYIF
jgi:L,D-transpeptidase ErfK/SrfK